MKQINPAAAQQPLSSQPAGTQRAPSGHLAASLDLEILKDPDNGEAMPYAIYRLCYATPPVIPDPPQSRLNTTRLAWVYSRWGFKVMTQHR
jgi:hypothetical protein